MLTQVKWKSQIVIYYIYSCVYTVQGKWASSTTTSSLFWSENNSFIGNIRRALLIVVMIATKPRNSQSIHPYFFQINKLQPPRINTFQRLICFDLLPK